VVANMCNAVVKVCMIPEDCSNSWLANVFKGRKTVVIVG